MILAVSRFRVANQMEQEVRAAILNRPRLVDSVAGFLGMEVFTDERDPGLFYLVTRWCDPRSFWDWRRSEGHPLSHLGIPEGPQLDASFTDIVVLDRLDSEPAEWAAAITDQAPLFGAFLNRSRAVCYVRASSAGIIQRCNEAVAALLTTPVAELVGASIWQYLTAADQAHLRSRLADGKRDLSETFLLNLVGTEGHPWTLECQLDPQPDGFTLIGELPAAEESSLRDELLQLNNEHAVLTRENARKTKLLEKTTADLKQAHHHLETSYWHLKKLQEVLPICMQCGKVKSSDGGWEGVVEYLKRNALFLSHGYCPECVVRVAAEWGLPQEKK
ncbi:MAG TPA: antibiotic biosynthesis monooxygenase family protein [Armatimonadota bacterium]|nr:antibiotic biosynthesis monooxygenase family protein [Armatimonadota bacterium]